jgi:MarR family transcriptional regulator, organic hydroperoxide resistance regulator
LDKCQNAERLEWEITSTSVRLEELRDYWAQAIKVTGPQWMIMMVLANADDRSAGLSVGAVSKELRVDQSFVGTQSRLLEQKNLVRRAGSPEDARVVNLSLTDRARKQMASFAARRREISEFIYEDFDTRELAELTKKISLIKARLEKAILKVSADL